VAIVWGIAISLAIYAIGAISGAHINPAITVAFATFRKFPIRKVPWYFLAQLLGAFLAAATLYPLFHGFVAQYELGKGIVRGMPGSELSGMIYGEYFPNPSLALAKSPPLPISIAQAILAEGIGTAFLAFFVSQLPMNRIREDPVKARWLSPSALLSRSSFQSLPL